MSARRLALCLTASALLHAGAITGSGIAWRGASRAAQPVTVPLQARLVRTAPPQVEPVPAEALLKDALDDAPPERTALAAAAPSVLPRASRGATQPLPASAARRQAAARRKLAEHLFYPPEALARGLEGEVRLLLTLDADGRLLEAEVARSSGHAVLDRAALRAAYAMGGLAGSGTREMILPVVFRLQ